MEQQYPQRKSPRLQHYNYQRPGTYFVTMCSHKKKPRFCTIEPFCVRLLPIGEAIEIAWNSLPTHFPTIRLDSFVVMPNHIHGLIHIDRWDGPESPEDSQGHGARSASLSSIVGSLKSAASKIYHQAHRSGSDEIIWQRGFYERIVRDERELLAARRYIEENPQRWRDDPIYAAEQ